MSIAETETLSVIVEREVAHPPTKVWRALTQPHLIEDWLMKNDFEPVVGHKFKLRGDWGGVLDCEVLAVEPTTSLSYSWNFDHETNGLKTIVTWTLTPAGTGTHLRMEQAGFRADQPQNYNGAKFGWRKFLDSLDQVLDREDDR